MENMKSKIKKHIEYYYAACKKAENEYAPFETKESKNYYAPIFLQGKANEKISILKNNKTELESKIENDFLNFVDTIKPNTDIVNSMEYQTKLSNVLNLLALNPEIDQSYFDFMVDANDFITLELLKDKYKSKSLVMAFNKVDKEKTIGEARMLVATLKSYIYHDKNFSMKDAILKTIY